MEETYLDPVHFFWLGNQISLIEKLSFQSCIRSGMTPLLWCYGKYDNLPIGTIIKDASAIMSKSEVDYYLGIMKLPFASVSDIFRFKLLDEIGGVYSDTDIIFIKNIYSIQKAEYFCSTYEYMNYEHASNCLMRVQKKSKLSQYLVKEVTERVEKYKNMIDQAPYCEFGPFVVQKCAKELNIEVLPYDVINPISWRWTKQIIAFKKPNLIFMLKQIARTFLPKIYSKKGYFLTKDTMAIHLCNEMWKGDEMDKNSNFHRFSLIEKLKSKILK